MSLSAIKKRFGSDNSTTKQPETKTASSITNGVLWRLHHTPFKKANLESWKQIDPVSFEKAHNLASRLWPTKIFRALVDSKYFEYLDGKIGVFAYVQDSMSLGVKVWDMPSEEIVFFASIGRGEMCYGSNFVFVYRSGSWENHLIKLVIDPIEKAEAERKLRQLEDTKYATSILVED